MAKGYLGLESNVLRLGLVSFFTDLSTEMIYPLLPLFLSVTLGVDKAFIGVIEGIAESSASISKVFSGWLSDRVKRRRPLIGLGYLVSTIAKPLFAICHTGGHVLTVRLAERLGKGIRTAPRDALIADSVEKRHMGRSFGVHRAMDTAGAVLGPLIAFILLPVLKGDYRSIFWLSVIPASAAVLIVFFCVRERSKPSPGEGVSHLKKHLGRDFRMFVVVASIFSIGNSSDAFLILRASSLGVPGPMISLLWMSFNVIYALTAVPGGILSDRFGRRRTISVAFLFYSLIYLGFAHAFSAVHAWVLIGLYGMYYGLSEGVMRAYVADLV